MYIEKYKIYKTNVMSGTCYLFIFRHAYLLAHYMTSKKKRNIIILELATFYTTI